MPLTLDSRSSWRPLPACPLGIPQEPERRDHPSSANKFKLRHYPNLRIRKARSRDDPEQASPSLLVVTYDNIAHRDFYKLAWLLTRLSTATSDPAQLLLRQLDLGIVGCRGRQLCNEVERSIEISRISNCDMAFLPRFAQRGMSLNPWRGRENRPALRFRCDLHHGLGEPNGVRLYGIKYE
jgi:hypothetical protein